MFSSKREMYRDCIRPAQNCRGSKAGVRFQDKQQTGFPRKARTIAGWQKKAGRTFQIWQTHNIRATHKGVQTANRAGSTGLTSDTQRKNYANLDNVPTLQSRTCMLSDDEPVTVRPSKSAVCTCSCMLLVEAQIMMLVITVIYVLV